MEKSLVKKRGPAAIFALCPAAHVIALLGGSVVALFFALRHDTEKMRFLSLNLVQPLHRVLARLTARLPFSLSEWLYAAVIGATLLYIAAELVLLVRRPARLRRLYRLFMRLAALGLGVYALFCLLWGVYYYGDDFIARSGLELHDISAEELELTTLYFADLLNEYEALVPRDENGLCRSDRDAILRRSPEVYDNIVKEFPCLDGPRVAAKGVFCSKVMSLLDFTGFFFPFTGEANVNTDSPEAFFASTVAHELAHQRGVAKEQEANFCAVLASFEYGDSDYCYSAALMGYVHLSNALYSADREAWQQIRDSLDREVMADLQYNSEYWAKYDTKVKDISNTVYEDFLESYGQELGLRSYGACVDLLVNRYYDTAVLALSAADSYSREP